MLRTLLSIFILCLPFVSFSQGNLAIGSWSGAIPFTNVIDVAHSPSRVYAATKLGLFYLDRSEDSVNRLTKIQGLSNIGITALYYHEPTGELYIGYVSGEFDILQSNKVTNFQDIPRSNLLGSKQINEFLFFDDKLYILTDYGMSLFDVTKKEINDSYYLNDSKNIGVLDLHILDDTIYCATPKGIYFAANNPNTAINPANWSQDEAIPHHDSLFNAIEPFGSTLIANYHSPAYNGDTIYQRNTDGGWTAVDHSLDYDIYEIRTHNNETHLLTNYAVRSFDADWVSIGNYSKYGEKTGIRPKKIEVDGDTLWIADSKYGLGKRNPPFTTKSYAPSGPTSNNVHRIKIYDDVVNIATGGVHGNLWANNWTRDGLIRYVNDEWELSDESTISALDSAVDIMAVVTDPSDKTHFYAASFSKGLFEIKNGDLVAAYNSTNSTLTSKVDPDDSTWYWIGVTDLAYDINGNLWLTNTATTSPLQVKTPAGDWYATDFSAVMPAGQITEVIINAQNHKWVVATFEGIVVVDDRGTVSDPSDDFVKLLSFESFKGSIPGSIVQSIAEDNNGQIWVGTNEGLAVFYNPEKVFTDAYINAEKILIEQNGYTQYLLETESVSALAVDGANRKWVGTKNAGAFLLSEDGTTELLHFTAENSPLFSNNILSIAINQNSGEVYLGTDEGIIIYRGDATSATTSFNSPRAFPNPVAHDYEGLIAISGLYRDANVKITDLTGNLIYEATANGGTVTWDGKYQGEKAPTGVYLAYCTDLTGAATEVVKILIVK